MENRPRAARECGPDSQDQSPCASTSRSTLSGYQICTWQCLSAPLVAGGRIWPSAEHTPARRAGTMPPAKVRPPPLWRPCEARPVSGGRGPAPGARALRLWQAGARASASPSQGERPGPAAVAGSWQSRDDLPSQQAWGTSDAASRCGCTSCGGRAWVESGRASRCPRGRRAGREWSPTGTESDCARERG